MQEADASQALPHGTSTRFVLGNTRQLRRIFDSLDTQGLSIDSGFSGRRTSQQQAESRPGGLRLRLGDTRQHNETGLSLRNSGGPMTRQLKEAGRTIIWPGVNGIFASRNLEARILSSAYPSDYETRSTRLQGTLEEL
jgi:hypothetical protein